MKNTKLLNNSGQTVIIVALLMVVALIIGISVSDRFIRGLRIISSSDNTSKALAMAEAGIERLLVVPYEDLVDYINFGSCGSACLLQITDETGQALTATITLDFDGESADPYPMTLVENQSAELSMLGYTSTSDIFVCWNGPNSVAAIYIFQENGTIKADAYAFNAVSSAYGTNGFENSASMFGYASCFPIDARGTPQAVRLKAFYGDVEAVIVPESGQIVPRQGIRIQSVGRAGSSTKTVIVVKTSPVVPALFDYVLYQKSDSETLSN